MVAATLAIELEFAKQLAKKAGAILIDNYSNPTGIVTKSDGTLVSDVDKTVATFIATELAKKFPQYAILDEENSLRHTEKQKTGIWIIDPLDGTRQYLAKGKDFGVLIGLVKNGKPVLGAAYRPLIDELVYAAEGHGAFIQTGNNVHKLMIKPGQPLSILVSDSRQDAELTSLLEIVKPAAIHRMHSAFKLVEVAKGMATGYMTSRINTMHVWDTCAPSAILAEAGGLITDLYGNPIDYSLKETTQCKRGIFASDKMLHASALKKIKPLLT